MFFLKLKVSLFIYDKRIWNLLIFNIYYTHIFICKKYNLNHSNDCLFTIAWKIRVTLNFQLLHITPGK